MVSCARDPTKWIDPKAIVVAVGRRAVAGGEGGEVVVVVDGRVVLMRAGDSSGSEGSLEL